MTTSSEDVLLQMSHVRFKKSDGTLYVMNERIAWIMENKDNFSVSHRYTDIKLQKISSEGKAKIQLQVVLHDGQASTFHFANPLGQAAQVKDRDDVKELLQNLLPKFKRKVNKELEEKNRLLSENPALLQLYRDLVITQVISSEEFWSQHTSQYTAKQQAQQQDIGVSGAFLADIKPQTDGCNGLKYNLTADIIESVFKTYPAVKRKHQEYVPQKMTESEFWTKFFQSHYFHRDRISMGTKDIFSECAKQDDQDLKKQLATGIEDSMVDITSFEDSTLDEGYGASAEKLALPQSGNIVHQSMIKRFNQHSIMVLKACQQNDSFVPENHIAAFKPVENSKTEAEGSAKKKARLQEKTEYEDLADNTGKSGPGLQLTRIDRYLQGPVRGTTAESTQDENPSHTKRKFQQQLQMWNSHKTMESNPTIAVSVLGELSPGGSLMKGHVDNSVSQVASPTLEQELKNLYICLCELLRHFWACFPPTSQSLEEKAVRMHETLSRFHAARLKPFEDRLLREHTPVSHQLTKHLNELLASAARKFTMWQQRKLHTLR